MRDTGLGRTSGLWGTMGANPSPRMPPQNCPQLTHRDWTLHPLLAIYWMWAAPGESINKGKSSTETELRVPRSQDSWHLGEQIPGSRREMSWQATAGPRLRSGAQPNSLTLPTPSHVFSHQITLYHGGTVLPILQMRQLKWIRILQVRMFLETRT